MLISDNCFQCPYNSQRVQNHLFEALPTFSRGSSEITRDVLYSDT